MRFLATLVCLALAPWTLAAELPQPTGSYPVGRVLYRWVDTARPERLSSKAGDHREVTVWIWFPAEHSQGGEAAAYVENLDRLESVLPKEQVALVRSVKSHTISGALLSRKAKQFPVLLFSPGAGSSPALYTAIIEQLASHGYVVAAVDHPYDSAAVILTDGRVVRRLPGPGTGDAVLKFDRERTNVRAQDLLFVWRQLVKLNDGKLGDQNFRGWLDVTKSAAFGHSIGGKAAAHACLLSKELRACANMDGQVRMMPAHPADAGRGFEQPFLFLEKAMVPKPMPGEKPEDAQHRWDALREQANALLKHPRYGRSYRISLEQATHAAFSDEEIISRSFDDPAYRRFNDVLRTTAVLLHAFFEESLAGKQDAVLRAIQAVQGVAVQSFGATK